MSVQNIGRNRWRVIVRKGYDAQAGKTRYHDKIVRGTRDDAYALMARLSGSQLALSSTLSFGDFLHRHWMPSLTVRDSTKEQYRYGLKHIQQLEPLLLCKLSARDIEAAVHALPPGSRRRLAAKVLSASLNHAVRWDFLPSSPMAKARLSFGQGATRRPAAYSLDELLEVFGVARGDKLEPVVLCMAFCGLRKEEALALDWEDIDLDAGAISISKAWTMDGNKPAMKDTKTAGSRRRVFIAGYGLERLRELGAEKTGAIITGAMKARMAPQSATRQFKNLIEAAGIRYVPLGNIRHTYATLALSSGLDVALVSRTLGHARISTTVDAYIRPLEGARIKAAEAFAATIKPK
jgi:integrase